MRPNARTTSETTSPSKPPTAWRTLSSSRPGIEPYPVVKQAKKPRYQVGDAPTRGASLGRIPFAQKHSNELSIRPHVTRDSMLDSLLFSFNQMPDGEGPYPKQAPLYSSFKDGEFRFDTPRFVYDALTHMSSNSRSSSDSSQQSLNRLQNSFNPYQIRNTPIRRSSVPKSRSAVQGKIPPRSSSSIRSAPSAATPSTSSTSRSKHRKKQDSSVEMERARNNGRRSKRRSRTLSANLELPPVNRLRRRSSTNTPAQPIGENIAPSVEPTNHIRAGRNFVPQETLSAPASASALPLSTNSTESFRSQSKSRNLIAGVGGVEATLVSSHSKSSWHSEQQLTVQETDMLDPVTSQKDTKSQPLNELAKERPGFFKRMFGSSRSNVDTPEQVSPRLPSPGSVQKASPKNLETANRTEYHASQRAPTREPPIARPLIISRMMPPPPPSEPQPLTMPVLHKKTSFFKRRRRNAPETERLDGDEVTALTLLQPDSPVDTSASLRDPSISSLQKIMGPFLNNPTITGESYDESKGTRTMESESDTYRSFAPASAPTTPHKSTVTVASPGVRAHTIKSAFSPASRSASTGPKITSSDHVKSSRSSIDKVLRPHRDDYGDIQDDDRSPVSLLTNKLQATNLVQPGTSIFSNAPQPSLPVVDPQPLPETRFVGSAFTTDNPFNVATTHASSVWPDSIRGAPAKGEDNPFPDVDRYMEESTSIKPRKRIWIEPDDSDVVLTDLSRSPPSPEMAFKTVRAVGIELAAPRDGEYRTNERPAVSIGGLENASGMAVAGAGFAEQVSVINNDHELAKDIFEGLDEPRGQATILLSQSGSAGERLRRAYMALYDFGGLNILLALRDLCTRLALKGETQQIDRVLASFSNRWCECNPNHGFKNRDVVHTICYSLLLLNTDLHVADMDQKMTRAQFIKNTLPTIRRVVAEDTLDCDSAVRVSNNASSRSSIPQLDVGTRGFLPLDSIRRRPSLDARNSSNRASGRISLRPASAVSSLASPNPFDFRPPEASENLVNAPFEGTMKAWQFQIEVVLKDFYVSIRQDQLPMYTASGLQLHDTASNASLTGRGNTLRRTGSVMSKAPSETRNSRIPDFRSVGGRWNSRNRSRPKLFSTSSIESGRASMEEQSPFSPSASSTWSKSYGRPPTSKSTESLGTNTTNSDHAYNQSMGFANALSQAMIRVREDDTNVEEDSIANGASLLLDDETLQLAGAPWAKEGIVHHKHHLEATNKKAKDRSWAECFAVIENGNMRLFSFTSKASVRSQKNKSIRGGVLGGGNWLDSAEFLGSFVLRQTTAEVLPPPGYSKKRPYVFGLYLPNGASHLFQVGTPEIAEEFVSTVNYWAARLSKEPLVGSVSNIEYGWSDSVINTALLQASDTGPPTSAVAAQTLDVPSRSSFSGSIRNSFDGQRSASRAKLPADRAILGEWTPPPQSMQASTLRATHQLAALQNYVKAVEEELEVHNSLKQALQLSYSPRHPNAAKATSNWEKKSLYLHSEIEKFRTYVESLKAAQVAQDKLLKERNTQSGDVDEANGTSGVYAV